MRRVRLERAHGLSRSFGKKTEQTNGAVGVRFAGVYHLRRLFPEDLPDELYQDCSEVVARGDCAEFGIGVRYCQRQCHSAPTKRFLTPDLGQLQDRCSFNGLVCLGKFSWSPLHVWEPSWFDCVLPQGAQRQVVFESAPVSFPLTLLYVCPSPVPEKCPREDGSICRGFVCASERSFGFSLPFLGNSRF